MQGDGVVQHAPPHWKAEEDHVFFCTSRIHAFWHLLALGKNKTKQKMTQDHSSFPLAFVTSSCKVLFPQALIHMFLDSLPALVMIVGTVMSYSAIRALPDM